MANPRMEGTHKPINRAESLSPLNHRTSEKTRERNAESSINRSVIVNLLSIKIYFKSVINIPQIYYWYINLINFNVK